jgi:hypothetical protein
MLFEMSAIEKTTLDNCPDNGLASIRAIVKAAMDRQAQVLGRKQVGMRIFARLINQEIGINAYDKDNIERLLKVGLPDKRGNKRLDQRLLRDIASFTYCEALGRPYMPKELIAIAQGELDPDQWHNQAASVTSKREMEELIRLIHEEIGRRQVSEQEFAEVLKLGGLDGTPEKSLQLLRAILGGKRPTFYELGKIARYVQNAGQYGDIEGMARLIGVEPPIDLEDREVHNPHKVENGY